MSLKGSWGECRPVPTQTYGPLTSTRNHGAIIQNRKMSKKKNPKEIDIQQLKSLTRFTHHYYYATGKMLTYARAD